MTGLFATRLFRIALALAGAYNLAFGIWAGFWPQKFFELFELEPPRYPEIWACLGMVVGVYGLLYWHAAWKPEQGKPIVTVGLIGKVLGPIGMALSISDRWPARLAMICVFNDAIWWLPFGLFLLRGTAIGKRLAAMGPWCCIVIHALALASMGLWLQHGTQAVAEPADRAAYILAHRVAWSIGWILWMASAASLVGFYAWWGSRLKYPTLATACVILTALGSVCDFTGESLWAFVLPEKAMQSVYDSYWNSNAFTTIDAASTMLTAGVANLLYSIAGIGLTLATRKLPRVMLAIVWIAWLAGIGMTMAAMIQWVGGLILTTVLLFPALLVFIAWMALRWRQE
ncbi:MAG TPA: hypothetical protein VGJ15_03165 [Pirellulales bacterium]|jgi:hypothetical protein